MKFVVATLFLATFSIQAQSLAEIENVEMDEISIDGQYESYTSTPQRPKSRADRLRDYREKLEQKNEEVIQTKIENIRYKNEVRLMKKMQKAMNDTLQAIDNIQ